MASSAKISSVFRPNLFKGKVAIVTGGGTGIGKAITQELLYLGCKVMIASRNLERLSASAQSMKEHLPNPYSQLEHMQCNIRKEEQVQSLISTTLAKFGRLDYLVNNGGGQFPSPASNIRLKGWNAVIETNLTGTFLCCREAYTQWMEQHGGVIVNIIADMWRGFPTMSHTGAARAGVDNITKSLAIEWAQSGVRINSVAPEAIFSETAAANYHDKELFKKAAMKIVPAKRAGTVDEGSSIYSETAAASYNDPKIFENILPTVPARRLGTVEEVSAAVCFLLSPAASFISGESMKVDAGASLYNSIWDIPDHNKIPAYKWSEDNIDNNDDSEGGGTKSKL